MKEEEGVEEVMSPEEPVPKRRRRAPSTGKESHAKERLAFTGATDTGEDKEKESTSTESHTAKPPTKSWTAWDKKVTNLFFDGLKMHGKEFRLLTRYMGQKGAHKSYQQVRSFYHNKLKESQGVVKFNDEAWLEKVPREAKDLFLLINYGEWRRRNLNFKGVYLDKFKELVLKGSTTVKCSGKVPGGKNQRIKTVRTPKDCPALRKFCEGPCDPKKSIPSKIVVELTPQKFGDKNYVLKCEQNPFLRIVMTPNQPLKPYFAYLGRKWITPDVRTKESVLNEDISALLPSITLYPTKDTLLSSGKIRLEKTPVLNALSLERCSLVHIEKEKGKLDPPTTPVCYIREGLYDFNPLKGKGFLLEENTIRVRLNSKQYGIYWSNITFSLTVRVSQCTSSLEKVDETNCEESEEGKYINLDPLTLRKGLSFSNVNTMTAGELCLLCSLSETIALNYSIEHPPQEDNLEAPDPWRCLMTLLRREYGDILQKSCQQTETISKTSTPKNVSTGASIFLEPKVTPKGRKKEKREPKVAPFVQQSVHLPIQSVAEENQAFQMQVRQLNPNIDVVARRQIVAPIQLKASSAFSVATTQPQHTFQSFTYHQPMPPTTSTMVFSCAPSMETEAVLKVPVDRGDSSPPPTHTNSDPPTDFSQLSSAAQPPPPSGSSGASLFEEFADSSPMKSFLTRGENNSTTDGVYMERILNTGTSDMDQFLNQFEQPNDGTLVTPHKRHSKEKDMLNTTP